MWRGRAGLLAAFPAWSLMVTGLPAAQGATVISAEACEVFGRMWWVWAGYHTHDVERWGRSCLAATCRVLHHPKSFLKCACLNTLPLVELGLT
eukprot:1145705-Pelagomonas_calceolata.AAC.2